MQAPGEAHQQEVNLPDHSILQVIPALVILKLDVQAVLDANVHLHRQAQART